MSVTLRELYDSRKRTNSGLIYHYLATGGDDAEAIDTAIAQSPAMTLGFWRSAWRVTPLAPSVYDVEIEYAAPSGTDGQPIGDPAALREPVGSQTPSDPQAPPGGVSDPSKAKHPGAPSGKIGDASPESLEDPAAQNETVPIQAGYSFTTSGGTAKVLYSRGTIASAGVNGAGAPDYGGAINVTRSGINGVDIILPKFDWTYTTKVAYVTLQYATALAEMTGSVNLTKWRGFPAGTLLFTGVNGQYQGGEQSQAWSLTFSFSYSRSEVFSATNPAAKDIPGSGSEFTKDGWDYLWIASEEAEDAGRIVKRPFAAYVERVYPRYDFRYLGIG